jgi:hypothetical protein
MVESMASMLVVARLKSLVLPLEEGGTFGRF